MAPRQVRFCSSSSAALNARQHGRDQRVFVTALRLAIVTHLVQYFRPNIVRIDIPPVALGISLRDFLVDIFRPYKMLRLTKR
jgi:hypothetical protein